MDLIKHIIFILQIITYTTGFMFIYEDAVNLRSKRSPADGFSLFGFNPRLAVPSTISQAKQSIGSIGNLFSPYSHSIRSEEKLQKPFSTSNDANNYERRPFGMTTPTSKTQNNFGKGNTYNSSLEDLVKPKMVEKYNKSEDKTNNDRIQQEKNTAVHNQNKGSHIKENITSNPSEEAVEIDKNLLNYIFQTTTEDPVTEFTTETTDYENSTSDELLRIPAAAVATLLGK